MTGQEVTAKDILESSEITVVEGGETFVFAIPSFMDEARRAAKVENLRRELETDASGSELDIYLVAAANIICFLRKGPRWVYSESADGKPVIDPWKWPPNKFNAILSVFSEYRRQVERFRTAS